MIALRGKLERVQKQTPVSSASSPEAPAAATTTADAKEELKTVEQWTWKGHWGFGGKLPEDEKLIQSFLYTFEKAVPPEDVLVPSQNYAPGVEDALERRFKEEMAERARRKQLEEEEEEARQEKKKESLLAATTTSKEENQYRTDAAEKEPEKKASKEEHLGNKTDDTEPSITETKKAEEPAKTKEEEKEKTTAPEQVKNPLVDSEKKQDESKEESAKIESTSRTQKKIEDNTATVKKSKILDNENMDKVKEEDKSKPSKLPESKTPTNDNKEETANAKSKRDTLEKDPAFTRRSKVTFATPPEDDDPPFTDAASKYPDKCPPGGSWTGYFENTIKPANKRKGKNAAPVIQQIMENFHVYLNATPPKDATYMFPDSDAPASRNKTTSNKEDTATASAEGALKEGHIHVRGAGTNQFGTYELIGYFDPETSILECQRMYVAPLEPPRTPTRRGSGRGGGAAGLQRTPLESNDGRPYFTRKRQPNWRRRSSFGSTGSDSDDDGAVTPGATRKRSSSAAGGSGGKRVRMTEPKSSTTTAAAGAVAGAGGTAKSTIGGGAVPRGGLSITIPGSTGKRPGPSPKGLGTPRKKVATGIGTPKSGGSTPGSVSGPTHYMRLPAVGDPKHAAWRAAHYLYYQRSDPSQESEGGAEKSTTGTNAAGNAFKVCSKNANISQFFFCCMCARGLTKPRTLLLLVCCV